MRPHVWTDFTTAGSSNFDCNNARCIQIRCVDLGHVALPTALYLQHYLVSFVRGTCMLRLCCRFHSQESGPLSWLWNRRFPSLWSLKSKSPVISTWLSKESALHGLFVDFSVAWGELPPPRYGCRRLLAHELHRRAKSNFRFEPVAQTQCPSTSRRPSLVVSDHALLKSFVEATAITSKTARQSQARLTSLFCLSWKRKPFLAFVFRVWSRRMFIWSQWCAWSSGFRCKVATAPSFLVAKPRVPVAKCDYVPVFFEPWLWYCT